jgi:hypothetical protein
VLGGRSSRSGEDRAGVVLDRAAGGGRPHEEEAARAERLVGALGLEAVDRLAALVDLRLLLVLVLLVLCRDHAVLEDPVEVGLDVVGGDEVVVVVLLLVLGALALAGADRLLGVVVVLFFELVLGLDLVVGLELLVGLFDQLVLVELGLVELGVLELGLDLLFGFFFQFDVVVVSSHPVSSIGGCAAGY